MATHSVENVPKYDFGSIWKQSSVLDVENKLLQQIMAARTPEAAEASVSYARFLRLAGLDTEN